MKLAHLKQGKEAFVDLYQRLILMRPIRASKASCLSCHAGAKKNQTLGVMIYRVEKTPRGPGEAFRKDAS